MDGWMHSCACAWVQLGHGSIRTPDPYTVVYQIPLYLLGGLGLLDDEGLLPREGVVHLADGVRVADRQALELFDLFHGNGDTRDGSRQESTYNHPKTKTNDGKDVRRGGTGS